MLPPAQLWTCQSDTSKDPNNPLYKEINKKVKRTLKAKLTPFIMPSKGPEGLYMTQI